MDKSHSDETSLLKRCYVTIANGEILDSDEWCGFVTPFERNDNGIKWHGLLFDNEATFDLVMEILFKHDLAS